MDLVIIVWRWDRSDPVEVWVGVFADMSRPRDTTNLVFIVMACGLSSNEWL